MREILIRLDEAFIFLDESSILLAESFILLDKCFNLQVVPSKTSSFSTMLICASVQSVPSVFNCIYRVLLYFGLFKTF